MKGTAGPKKGASANGPPRAATGRAPVSHHFRGKVLLFLGSLFLCAIFGEVGLRIFCRELLSDVEEKASLGYRYDSELGWFPVPNSNKQVSGSRIFTATHNSKGFRESERASTDKPALLF